MKNLTVNQSVIITLTVFASLILYWLYLVIYRLYFAPVARFPGPKLAAITYLYEFYHDRLFAGRYVFKIQELHKQYGQLQYFHQIKFCTLLWRQRWSSQEVDLERAQNLDTTAR